VIFLLSISRWMMHTRERFWKMSRKFTVFVAVDRFACGPLFRMVLSIGRELRFLPSLAFVLPYPEGLAAFAQMSKNAPMLADSVKKSPLATMYPKTNWETSFKKMGELNSTPFDWSAQVKALKEPTLLVFADADAVRAEHIVEFYKALGGAQRDAGRDGSMRSMAQLAILPGTTHYNINASPSLAVVIGEFLRR
jgi:hypothetical protein